MGIDCALLRDVPPAEHHHSGDRGGLPLPRRRGLPLAGPAQGLPALADGALVVGPLPPRGRVGPRHPRADARGAHRRRGAEPRTGLVDSQSVRCGPQKGDRGWDGGKKINGRKRHVLTCSAGFLLAALVTAASVHDKHGPDPLLARAHAAGWRLRRLTGDGSYAGEDVAGGAARHGGILTVAARPRERRGFVPIPLRWRVEQAFGILTTRSRRLVRDWEQLPEVSETMMLVANLRHLIRAVARSR